MVELINKGFTYEKGRNLYRKGIQCVDDFWDTEQSDFLNWDKAQEKFNLTPTEAGDWTKLTGKFSEWRNKLEDDSNTTHPGQWLGFYVDGGEDPTFVMKCVAGFSPSCMQLQSLSMPILVQCFTVGTHSRCLRGWEKPTRDMDGFFHKVKSYIPLEARRRKVSKRISFLFMLQRPRLNGTRIGGGGLMDLTFLTTPLS